MTDKERLIRAEADATAFDATMKELGARTFASPSKSVMPQGLKEFIHRGRTVEDGFLFLVELPDQKGKIARCLGYQSGKFWPAIPQANEGMGAIARNGWAAKRAAEVYKTKRGDL
jgi:hypothetical protein